MTLLSDNTLWYSSGLVFTALPSLIWYSTVSLLKVREEACITSAVHDLTACKCRALQWPAHGSDLFLGRLQWLQWRAPFVSQSWNCTGVVWIFNPRRNSERLLEWAVHTCEVFFLFLFLWLSRVRELFSGQKRPFFKLLNNSEMKVYSKWLKSWVPAQYWIVFICIQGLIVSTLKLCFPPLQPSKRVVQCWIQSTARANMHSATLPSSLCLQNVTHVVLDRMMDACNNGEDEKGFEVFYSALESDSAGYVPDHDLHNGNNSCFMAILKKPRLRCVSGAGLFQFGIRWN